MIKYLNGYNNLVITYVMLKHYKSHMHNSEENIFSVNDRWLSEASND